MVVSGDGLTSIATVTVESANILAPVTEPLATNDEETTSLRGIISRTETAISELIDIRLSGAQVGTLSFVPILLGFMSWLLRDRERLVSVSQVSNASTLVGERLGDGAETLMRHDALAWSGRRTRRRNGEAQTLILRTNGERTWVATDKIADTGY